MARTIALGALLVGSLAPVAVLADWDEERIKRDHPQILAGTTTTGLAAGDTTRNRTRNTRPEKAETGSNADNDKVWAGQVRRQSESP